MSTLKFTLLILLTTFLMGSSFAVVKIGLHYSSPLLLAALRFTLAGIIMAIIVFALKRPHPVSIGSWIKLMVIGALQTAGVMGCIFLSLRTITASESSILTFTNPLFVVVFGTIFLKIRYQLYKRGVKPLTTLCLNVFLNNLFANISNATYEVTVTPKGAFFPKMSGKIFVMLLPYPISRELFQQPNNFKNTPFWEITN